MILEVLVLFCNDTIRSFKIDLDDVWSSSRVAVASSLALPINEEWLQLGEECVSQSSFRG
ncbi:hypothetical protein DVH24_006354 [Malus domestica]|uniref:Uncharacterized protein n=1 Tax=Malus domestica TaxID=3750 RepID=A0A498KCL5_MALDO|nr:hypothetical protein DVH24_006354 [Malus domestica]